MGNSVIPQ